MATLVHFRIKDMKELKKTLRNEARQLKTNTKEYGDIVKRYQAIDDAIDWWNELKDEGKEV